MTDSSPQVAASAKANLALRFVRSADPAALLLVKRGIQAVGGEGVQGIVHYAINLMLIAQLRPEQYSIFASVILFSGIAVSYMNALASTSLQVHLPHLDGDDAVELQATLLAVAIFVATFVVVVASSVLLVTGGGLFLACTAGGVIGLWSMRTFVKAIGYAHGKGVIALTTDGLYAAIASVVLLINVFGGRLQLPYVLSFLLTANIGAIFAGGIAVNRIARLDLRRANFNSYRRLFHEVGWTALGNTATTIQAYAYAFALRDVNRAAFAALSASLALFGPVRLAVGAWQNAVRADLARSTNLCISYHNCNCMSHTRNRDCVYVARSRFSPLSSLHGIRYAVSDVWLARGQLRLRSESSAQRRAPSPEALPPNYL